MSNKITIALTVTALASVCLAGGAPTNSPPLFQGYSIGTTVRVRSEKPLILLNRATLKEITSSNIVVAAGDDRYVLSKTNTVLSDSAGTAAASISRGRAVVPVSPSSLAMPALPQQDFNSLMAGVQQSVLGKYANHPGHGKAVEMSKSMMDSFQSGKMSLEAIAAEAEKQLAEVDKYKPEREKDPQFEQQIALLRDFVRRVRAGEKLEQPRPE